MFEMSLPWWEFALRGGVCYLGLLISLRIAGKRAFGEMSPFDIVVLIIVGGTFRSAIVGADTSLLGPFIAVATILLLDKALCWLAAANPWVDRILEGNSAVLVRGGKLIPGALFRHSISQAAFERELRSHELRSVREVEEARLEANGRLTFLKQPRSAP